jgi:cysteine desulfurase
VDAMLPYFTDEFANPSSSSHKLGQKISRVIELARESVAELIGAAPNEILFTSGATESNNLSILGLANYNKTGRHRIVTSEIEHKSILEPCNQLRNLGFDLIVLPVERNGLVNLEKAREVIDENTLLVTIQTANNEIGTIQDISELSEIAHEKGSLFHTDAAQAVGKIPVNIEKIGVDFLSISAHKLYGPKGVGALFIKNGPSKSGLHPLQFGGGQEQSLRPGTYNVPGIVGLSEACKLCNRLIEKEAVQVANLRNLLEDSLSLAIPDLFRNGYLQRRLPGNSSITVPGIDSEAIIANVPDLALSIGSACNSGALEPSYVLQAIGLTRKEAYETLRIGIGRFTSENEMIVSSKLIIEAVDRIKAFTKR